MTIYFSWLTAPIWGFFYVNCASRVSNVSGKTFKKVLPRFLSFKLIGDIYITLKNRDICQQIKRLSQ